MRKVLSVILIGFFLVLLLDTLGSIASRQMNFEYGCLLPFSLLIYTGIPFFIAKKFGRKAAIISGGLLGFFDATIGWAISIKLRANTGNHKLSITPLIYITTAIFVILTGVLFGRLGSWLAQKRSAKNSGNH